MLALGEGEGPANVDGKDGTHSSSPDYTAPSGQKMQRFSVFMKKSKNRLKLSFQPVLFGAADEARTRYLHLGKVALYQMSYGRIKKSPKICSVIFLLAAPVRLERTTP